MTSTLEINIKDDWLDVSTKEEILGVQVLQLRKELEKSNQMVKELEGQKAFADSESEKLQAELKHQKKSVMHLEIMLKDTSAGKESTEAQLESAEESLASSKSELGNYRDRMLVLQCEIKDIRRQQEKDSKEAQNTIQTLTKSVSDLKTKLATSETNAKSQEDELTRSYRDVKQLHLRLGNLRNELTNEKKISSEKTKQLDLANTRLGSVALLAEGRKDESTAHVRTITQQKNALEHAGKDLEKCRAELSKLMNELSRIKVASEMKTNDLEVKLNEQQSELQKANAKHKSEVGGLKAKLKNLEATHDQIDMLQADLQSAKSQVTALEGDLTESKESERKAREEMEKQRESYEKRLANIRESLSLDIKPLINIQPKKTISSFLSKMDNLTTYY